MSGPLRLRPWAKPGDVFLLWRPEQGEAEEDAREVEANDSETAAEDWAEHDDSGGDYCIVNGNEATVHVRRYGLDGDGAPWPVEVFVVLGETVPQYTARPAKAAP